MYAGCESPGGSCEEPKSRSLTCEVSNACAMDGNEISVTCKRGAKRVPFVGAVPSVEQFSAQHKRAVAMCASLLGMSAAMQQFMSPIAWSMPQACSPNCIGTPPNALPLSISTSTRDVRRIRMTVATL